MSDALTVCGIPIPVVDSSRTRVPLGEITRSESGAVRNTERGEFYDYRFQTAIMTQEEGAAMRSLISGKGEVFAFNLSDVVGSYLWSSRGRVIQQGGDLSTVTAVTFPKHGDRAASVSDLGGAPYVLLPVSSTWTLMGWMKDVIGTGWHHFIITSSGAEWQDGVFMADPGQTVYEFFNVNVEADGLAFNTQTVGPFICDDLVYLPFSVPAAWPPLLYAFHNANPWPALPFVTAGGARFGNVATKVMGKVGEVQHPEYMSGGVWTLGESFDFLLMTSP